MNKKIISTKMMCLVGLMAALVFVGTSIRIKIPAGMDGVMLHLGNVFCLLSGLLFGGVPGGLAAGFGSGLFDLLSEYASEAPITFINKFAMGLVAGLVMVWAQKKLVNISSFKRTLIAAFSGSMTYCALYILKTIIYQHFVYGLPWAGVWPIVGIKAAVTLFNAVIAIIVSSVLYLSLYPAMQRAKLIE